MRFCIAVAVVAVAAALPSSGGAFAAEGQGHVEQSIPPVVVSTKPPLALSDVQRDRIRAVLARQDTQVSFALKAAKSAKSFEPRVGAKMPSGIKSNAFPPPLIYEMPLLERYGYVKFKDQTLIVDPMSGKIVEVMPQT
jgi:hypothetical protein